MTCSIVAGDPDTGEMGVAMQSQAFAAGAVVPWAQAGVGVVATQATTEIAYGPKGLDLIRAGTPAAEVLERLLHEDEDRQMRLLSILDARGAVATHTGKRCIREAGHRTGTGFSCQANMMWRPTVWDAMASAYGRSTGDLADRLLGALDAAQAEGGDLRGVQAAVILIVAPEELEEPWRGVVMHLRVDDHPDPLGELRRLVRIHRAYDGPLGATRPRIRVCASGLA